MSYNGAGMVAMTGKNCVAIASDLRFGSQGLTLGSDMKKIFKMTDSLYIGLAGLATDMLTVAHKLEMHLKMFRLREERDISPQAFSHYVSNMLYEKRFGPFFVEPVIAGLDAQGNPFIDAMDVIGAGNQAKDFVVAGTSSENLMGVCESLYRTDMARQIYCLT